MRAAAVAAVLCALALAGCASVSDDAQERSLAALETLEPKPRAKMPQLEPCDDPLRKSLAPSTLPRPGHMPAGSFMREIQDAGKLVAGVDQNSLGLGYYNPVTRRLEGFDIDVVRLIAQAIFGGDPDDHVLYKAVSTPQREPAVYFEDVHLVVSAFSITCKRLKLMRFSSPYHRTRQRLLVPEDSTVGALEDLGGGTVCGTRTSTSAETLKRLGVKLYEVTLRSDCLVALQERRVDAVTSDETILWGFCQQDPQVKIVGPSLGTERYGVALHRDRRGFERFVNAVLLANRARLERSREKWLKGLDSSSDDDISDCPRPETS